MKKEFIVGIFVAIGIVFFCLSIFIIKDIRLEKGYRLNIYFDNVGNLMEKAWVRMRGVKVGKVEKILLENEKAKVVVWIKGDVKIHRGSKARISSTGVLGVKYLELTVGDITQPLLKDGDEIYSTESVFSIDEAISGGAKGIKKFSEFLEKISEDEKVVEKFASIVNNIDEFTKKLNNAVEQQQLKNTIKSLEVAGKTVEEILVTNKENIKTAMLSLRNVSQKIDQLVEQISSTETVVGQVLVDKSAGEKVSQTIDSLKLAAEQANRTLNRINLFRTYWDYRSRYDLKNEELKSDIGIEIFPKETKFYFITVNNVTSQQDTGGSSGSLQEQANTVSIGLGGRFYEVLTVYGGLIRSSGGVGVKIFPFGYKSKLLEFGSEVYNFSKSRSSPCVDLSVRLKLTKWLYVGSRYEDINVTQTINTTLNISFEDEDIAYLLGLIGLTR